MRALSEVRQMTDVELTAEYDSMWGLWDTSREDEEGHSGSPGEWIMERIDEIETEQKRRKRGSR
jgi:hypothetical protein